MCEQMLDTCQIFCRANKTACISKKFIDYISSNITKNKILHFTLPNKKRPLRTLHCHKITGKQIWNASEIHEKLTTFWFDLDTLNKLILMVIDKHAPLVKTKFSRSPST